MTTAKKNTASASMSFRDFWNGKTHDASLSDDPYVAGQRQAFGGKIYSRSLAWTRRSMLISCGAGFAASLVFVFYAATSDRAAAAPPAPSPSFHEDHHTPVTHKTGWPEAASDARPQAAPRLGEMIALP